MSEEKTEKKKSTRVDAIELLERGSPMRIHGKKWVSSAFDYRMFQMIKVDGLYAKRAVVWSKKSKLTEERIFLSDIDKIVRGQQSAGFKKNPRPEYENMSFSIVYNAETTGFFGGKKTSKLSLDLICSTESVCNIWVSVLEKLLKQPFQKEFFIPMTTTSVEDTLNRAARRFKSGKLPHRESDTVADKMKETLNQAADKSKILVTKGFGNFVSGFKSMGSMAGLCSKPEKDKIRINKERMKRLREKITEIGKLLSNELVKKSGYCNVAAQKLTYLQACLEECESRGFSKDNDLQYVALSQGYAEAQALFLKLKVDKRIMARKQRTKK